MKGRIVLIVLFIPFVVCAQTNIELVNISSINPIWEPVNFTDTIHTRAINAEKEGILFVSSGYNNESGRLFRSYDNGDTWQELQTGLPANKAIFSIRYHPNGTLFLGGQNFILRSYNDGETFEVVHVPGGNVIKINFSPSGEIYAVGWIDIIRSADNGNTWEIVFIGSSNYRFRDIDFGINDELYTIGDGWGPIVIENGFHRSLDNGITWEHIEITKYGIRALRVNTAGTIIVSSYEGIHMSTDLGLTWTVISNISPDCLASYEDDKLIAGSSIYAGSGCWFSPDWGYTWTDLVDTIINPNVNQISVSPSSIVYIQSNKKVEFDYQIFKSINPILIHAQQVFSHKIKIYPNPASTHITIETPFNGQVSIMNLQGQELLNHQITEPKTRIDISTLPSGVYLIKATGKRVVQVGKIIKQ